MSTNNLVNPSLPLTVPDLTAENLTRLYLYGDIVTPIDLNDRLRPLVDESRKTQHPTGANLEIVIKVSESSFMASGAGRFANAGAMAGVDAFFTVAAEDLGGGLYRYVFSRDAQGVPIKYIDARDGDAVSIRSLINTHQIGGFFQDVHQSALGPGGASSDQKLDEIYVSETNRFSLNSRPDDEAVFVFHHDATLRSIQNMKLEVSHDDFDFEGGNLATIAAPLEQKVDPYGLGLNGDGSPRTVGILYDRDQVSRTYSYSDFVTDQNREDPAYGPTALQLTTQAAWYPSVLGYLVDRMESNGVLEYERVGYQIVYGTSNSDHQLSHLDNKVADDIAVSTVLVGGTGSDTFISGRGLDEKFLGGNYDDAVKYSDPAYNNYRSDVDVVDYRMNAQDGELDGGIRTNNTGKYKIDLVSSADPHIQTTNLIKVTDPDGAIDVLEGIEEIYLPGSAVNPVGPYLPEEHTIARYEGYKGPAVKIFDSTGTSQTDKIEIKKGNGPGGSSGTPSDTQGAIELRYDQDAATQGAKIEATIEDGVDDQTRIDNLIFIDGIQLAGGSEFDFDVGDMRTRNGQPFKAFFGPEYGPFLTVDAWQAGKSKAIEHLMNSAQALLGAGDAGAPTVPASMIGFGGGMLFANLSFYEAARWDVDWTELYHRHFIGQQREEYIVNESKLISGEPQTLEIRFNNAFNPSDLVITIENWKDGDFGIRLKNRADKQGHAVPSTYKDAELDSIAALDEATLLAALKADGIIANDSEGEPEGPPSISRTGNHADNVLAGGDGNDVLNGGAGNDTLLGNAGRDEYVFTAGDGNDIIDDQSVEGSAVNFAANVNMASVTQSEVAGSNGATDLLITYAGANTIRVVNWSLLSNETKAAWTFGNLPVAQLTSADLSVYEDHSPPPALAPVDGTAGADNLVGNDTAEYIAALDGNDTVRGNAGDDHIDGGRGDDNLEGGFGNDTILGGAGNDTIRGNAGNDTLTGGYGSDTFFFELGDGFDTITGESIDTLVFGAGITPTDIVFSRPFPLSDPSSGDGSDVLVLTIGQNGDGIRFTGGQVTAIKFANGTVWSSSDIEAVVSARLQPTSGDDDLVFGAGGQTIAGGAGDDRLSGGAGNDTYVWNRGDGNDLIRDDGYLDGADRLAFGAGITTADVTITRFPFSTEEYESGHDSSGDIVVTVAGTGGGSIRIFDWVNRFNNDSVELITFADGTVWSRDEIFAQLAIGAGTSGNDEIYGTPLSETINGGDGDDDIYGGTFSGAGGQPDVLIGGAGNDNLDGVGTLIGGTGNDTYRNTTQNGSMTAVLEGNFGTDTIGYLSGPADRVVFADRNVDDLLPLFTWGGNVSFPYAGSVEVRDTASGDKLVLSSGISSSSNIANDDGLSAPVDVFEFANGETLSGKDLFRISWVVSLSSGSLTGSQVGETLNGTASNDRIYLLGGDDTSNAGAGNDTVYAGAGDDAVSAGDGTDVVFGGDGADTVYGGLGNDFLLGNEGNDNLYGEDGRDFLFGGAGNDTIEGGVGGDVLDGDLGADQLSGGAGDDVLRGGLGNDSLTGGTGNDTINTGGGADTIYFNLGDGTDWIEAIDKRVASDSITLSFGAGITSSNINFSFAPINWLTTAFAQQDRDTPYVTNAPEKGPGIALQISITGSSERIGIADFLGNGRIDQIVFSTGGELNSREILERATGSTAGNDTPAAIDYNGYGLEYLQYGGRGNDTLNGTGKRDTFIFGKGDGSDIAHAADDSDEVYIWNATPDEVTLTRGGLDNTGLIVGFTNAADTLIVPDHYDARYLSTGTLHQIRFADGTVWTTQQINDRVLAAQATAGNDVISDPDYVFVPRGSDNTVAGGLGDDTIAGGYGDDTYVYALGDGNDIITDRSINSYYNANDVDTLSFAEGIRPQDVQVTQIAGTDDIELVLPDGGRVRIVGEMDPTGQGVERVTFADGTVWSRGELITRVLAQLATVENDTISGTTWGETLVGGLGNDTLIGGAGSDIYRYNLGDGADTIIETGAGSDTLAFGAGIARSALQFARATDGSTDLIIIVSGGGSITVKDQFSGSITSGVELITLADGTRLDRNAIEGAAVQAQQTSGADIITGSPGTDVIAGGAGNDTLRGGAGADTYVFNVGDGQDRIEDTGGVPGQDSIAFGLQVTPADVDLYRSGSGNNDLVAAVRGTTDTITIGGYFAPDGASVGTISFVDGTTWDASEIAARANNAAPVANLSIPDQAAQQDAAFAYTVPSGLFTDAEDSEPLQLSARLASGDPLPTWLQFDGATFTGTPRNADFGTIVVAVIAADSFGDTATANITLTVSDVNDAPIVTIELASRPATEGSPFSYAFPTTLFSDPDAAHAGGSPSTLTYSVTVADGGVLPAWLSFDAETRTLSGTPPSGSDGPLDLRIVASDGISTAIANLALAIGNGASNVAPVVATPIEAQSATEDSAFSFTVPSNTFTDSAGDRVVLSATLGDGSPLPPWLHFDAVAKTFSGTPQNGDVGTAQIKVTATDIFGAIQSTDFALTVSNTNDAPTVTGTLSNDLAVEGQAYSKTIPAGLFADTDVGDTLSYSAKNFDGAPLPAWLSLANGVITGTPDDRDVGVNHIVVTATDATGATVSVDYYILVKPTNDAPTVLTPVPLTVLDVSEQSFFDLPSGIFRDADDLSLSVTASLADGSPLPYWLRFDSTGSGRLMVLEGAPSPATGEGLTFPLKLTATDQYGASVATTFDFVLGGPPPPPLNPINGSAGSDTIDGTSAADLIDGAAGDDTLQGREGSDVYVFGHGSGHDVITRSYTSGTNSILTKGDIIEFAADVTPEQVKVERVSSVGSEGIYYYGTIIDDVFRDDLLLTLTATGETIRVEDQFISSSENAAVSLIKFADGTVWTPSDLIARLTAPTDGNDLLLGNGSANVINGGNGHDSLFGFSGDDVLNGGLGNDDLYGGTGDDIYTFELGGGQDRIIDLTSSGYDATFDTLRFGAGISLGDLTFVRDYRDPTPLSAPVDAGSLLIQVAGTSDQVRLHWQYYIDEDVSYGIDRFEFVDGTVLTRVQLDAIVNPGNLMLGTDGAETLFGSSLDERLVGLKGDDVLKGNGGNDTYVWNLGDGKDVFSEYQFSSHDVLQFGTGIRPEDVTFSREFNTTDFLGTFAYPANDLVFTIGANQEKILVDQAFYWNGSTGAAQHSIEEYRFEDGTVWTVADLQNYFLTPTALSQTILGFDDHAERIDGGAGDDVLTGFLGGDTYVFNRGYGADVITFDENNWGEATEKVEFGAAVSSTDITIERVERIVADKYVFDWVFSINGTSDTLTLQTNDYDYEISAFQSLQFLGNATTWSWSTVKANYLSSHQTSGDDIIIGYTDASIDTGAGDDVIRVNEAAAVRGGEGDDTYVFDTFDGRFSNSIIITEGGLSSDVDTLEFKSGILPEDVTLTRASNGLDLVVEHEPSDLRIVVRNHHQNAAQAIEQIRFSNGAVWNAAAIASMTVGSPAEAKPLNGTAADETLTGQNDVPELIDGKGGNDLLVGGVGDDTYIFTTTSGQDVISEPLGSSDTDTVRFVGINSTDVTLLRRGVDLVVTLDASNALTIEGQFTSGVTGAYVGVEELAFADGVVWGRNDIGARAWIQGTTAAETLTDTSGNDTLVGAGGADTIRISGGDDIVRYSSGDGNDTIEDSSSSTANIDRLVLTDLNASDVEASRVGADLKVKIVGTGEVITVEDQFYSATWNYGFEQIAFLDGTAWNRQEIFDAAWVRGTDAADTLASTSWDDTYFGGLGNDTINSGAGSDTFLYRLGDGADIINETSTTASEVDTLKFTNVNSSAVSLAHVGVDLMITTTENGQTIEIDEQFSSTTSNWGISRIVFGDGEIWDLARILAETFYRGTEGDDNIVGSAFNDNLDGGAGNDTLNGGAGADLLIGGAGNDTYVVDNAGDIVTELPDGGIDLVNASISYTLGDNVENLTLTGSAANTATGNALANTLIGNSGANVLDGGTGADTLSGGSGNDVYIVDDAGDVVTEGSSGGTDRVESTVSYVLGANIENLTLLGDAVSGTGNTLANVLIGNAQANTLIGDAGNDTLDGRAGADVLIGGAGHDVYIIDDVGDLITEAAGGGTDTVQSSINFSLGADLENLTLIGAALNGTGNAAANDIIGNEFDNTLDGAAGNDTLDGGLGADTLIGGVGNDTFVIDNVSDVVIENAGEGTDEVESSITYSLGANVENLTLTGSAQIDGTGNALANTLVGNAAANTLTGGDGNDSLSGGAGADVLIGGSGNDTLNGGADADQMIGGEGDDSYTVDNAGDTVSENANEGVDTVNASVTFTLGSNIEKLVLTGSGAINGTGNGLDNTITGNSGANTLEGGDGNDTLNGGSGADTLIGGLGNDVFVIDNAGDVIFESPDEGTDLVQSSISYALLDDLENLTLTGSSAINGTGNSADNVIIGNSGANTLIGGDGDDVLDGGSGIDTMIGGLGNDTYVVNVAGDVVTENASEGIDTIQTTMSSYSIASLSNIENLTGLSSSALALTGNSGSNVITGSSGNDTLDGGAGADSLIGGAGNDIYIVDDVDDLVVEAASAGTDRIQTALATYSLAGLANVENLTGTSSAGQSLTGNSAANTLTGSSGDDILDGGAGADTLIGGLGNDVYVVDVAGDVVTETASAGTDTIQTALASYSISSLSNIENLTGLSSTGQVLTGNSGANVITGGAGNDTLNGGAGIDTLVGGQGDDIYIVDVAGDVVTETADGGSDTIRTALASYSIATLEHIENLTGTASGAQVLTGNAGANTITGGTGNDTLDGGAGADVLIGGSGNDTYFVDVAEDTVTESASSGTDTIKTGLASYSIAAVVNVENLTGTSATGQTLSGNSLANTISGGSGDDTLDGGAGADTMAGGLGNDVYVVDVSSDIVSELAGGGVDTVQSSITYSLVDTDAGGSNGGNVENLVLTGTSAINGTGNGLANSIVGNTGANVLNGGLGNDILTGDLGTDSFVFNSTLGASNVDAITDFSVVDDTIHLENTGSGLFNALTSTGALAATAFVTGSAAETAAHRIVYDSATGELFYDSDGTGAAAAVKFATIGTGLALTNQDFLVI